MSENTTPAVPDPEGQMRTRDRDELAELALLYGTYMIGYWAQVMASDDEPDDDWQETAAREAVDLFAPGAADWLAQRDRRVRAEALREAAEDWEGGPTGDAPIPRWWLGERANRIEAGE